jgi:hypothetical protein
MDNNLKLSLLILLMIIILTILWEIGTQKLADIIILSNEWLYFIRLFPVFVIIIIILYKLYDNMKNIKQNGFKYTIKKTYYNLTRKNNLNDEDTNIIMNVMPKELKNNIYKNINS